MGKRLMGLWVYDSNTLAEAGKKQCIERNLFFFLYFIDGILLLATGKTIGDRAAGTAVLSPRFLPLYQAEKQRGHSEKKTAKQGVQAVAIILVCILAFVGFIQIVLNGQKDTEEYRLAQEYLVASEAFAQLNADASKIRMNSYSASTNFSKDDGSAMRTVRIGFLISMQSYEVVCHRENGIWRVCEECTMFD